MDLSMGENYACSRVRMDVLALTVTSESHLCEMDQYLDKGVDYKGKKPTGQRVNRTLEYFFFVILIIRSMLVQNKQSDFLLEYI